MLSGRRQRKDIVKRRCRILQAMPSRLLLNGLGRPMLDCNTIRISG